MLRMSTSAASQPTAVRPERSRPSRRALLNRSASDARHEGSAIDLPLRASGALHPRRTLVRDDVGLRRAQGGGQQDIRASPHDRDVSPADDRASRSLAALLDEGLPLRQRANTGGAKPRRGKQRQKRRAPQDQRTRQKPQAETGRKAGSDIAWPFDTARPASLAEFSPRPFSRIM